MPQRLTTKTHPPTVSRGISVDQFMRTNVVSDDSARADEATLAQSYTANYRCVRADRDSFFNPRFYRYPGRVAAPRSEIISQHRIWTKENVIRNVHMLPHAHAILDRNVVADRNAALDVSVIADVAMRA